MALGGPTADGFQWFLAKRLAIFIVLTFAAVSVIFAVSRLFPGSPFESLVTAGNSNQQQIAETRVMYSLDQLAWRQYLSYLRNILPFQLGHPILRSQPVQGVLVPRFADAFILLVPALVMTAVLSSLFGARVDWNCGSKLEGLSIIATTPLQSTLVFITGILLAIISAYSLELVPVFKMHSTSTSPEGYAETFASSGSLHRYILPFMASVLYYSSDFLLPARNGVVERRESEFLELHRAKGLPEMQQPARAGRNSMLPILTYFVLRLGVTFQGLILLEVVFNWPGTSREPVLAIQQQDYSLMQATVFIMAPAIIVASLVINVLYVYFDPTVSTGGGGAA